ncbi:MAG: DUF4012 domain-containing protein [Acidimicrobiia bacterium]|nr:DUF4012 domain-containing protein [Acidimicrobiia bacterium]
MARAEARLGRRRGVLLGLAIALLLVAAVALEITRIRRDLDAGQRILTELDLATVDDQGGLGPLVARAADHLDAADARARRSPVLAALAALPWVGGQIDGLREITGAVSALGERGREAAARIQTELDKGSGPESRIELTQVAAEELAAVRAVVETTDVGNRWLLPPLEQARASLAEELVEANDDLDHGAELVAALEGFLTGPRRYLVLGGNNAEMRSGGIPTTSGVATISNGRIEVGDFTAVVEGIELNEPGVPVPVEYEQVYGFLNGDRGYRTTTATANFPLAARIMADITAWNRHGPVDGIIFVDTVTLSVLLHVIGPVKVGDRLYHGGNVVEELLYRNYLEFPSLAENDARRELQSQVANAVFDGLNNRDYSVTRLAGVLSDLARTRHLLAWSTDPAENELWASVGADGALTRDTLGVVSNALNASKLDYFVSMEVDLDAEITGVEQHLTMTVRLINPVHPETSPYIDGGGIYADPGEYGSYLVVYLPAGATNIRNEDPGFVHAGPDADTFAAGMILRVPEGESREVVVTFSLPLRPDDSLRILPNARLRPTQWTVDGDVILDDTETFEVQLTEDGPRIIREDD